MCLGTLDLILYSPEDPWPHITATFHGAFGAAQVRILMEAFFSHFSNSCVASYG